MHGPNQHHSTFVPADRANREKLARTASNLSDRLAVSLQRLEASGAFDRQQLQLIENELLVQSQSDDSFYDISLLQPGDHVERFVIDALLGCGGEAHVFRAHDSETGKLSAIKVLRNARTSERFRREMEMVQQMAHPNIVTAYEVSEIRGMPYIAMELMQGPDLNVLVAQKGPIGWQQSSRYILQIACALSHAHRRDLVHRDIKPGNIILNGEDRVKLVDLGLAFMAMHSDDETHSLHLTRGTQIAGTLPYMAPEQARSLAKADARSDIYSLGATWFYLLTGKTRVRGKSFSRQYKNLVSKRKFRQLAENYMPESLRCIYEKMTAYDRCQRYQNCCLLKKDLEKTLTDLGQDVSSSPLSVLIVEDSQSDMVLAVELLRIINDSLVIHQAGTLADGISIYCDQSVDLIFLDLTLPDSAGVETVKKLRDQAPDVPIVVLTGMSDDETARECVNAGANEFISKTNLTAHKLERVIFITLSRYES